jgi:choline dehydrogenase-like flavoprotein
LSSKYDVSHDASAFGTSGPIQISYINEYSASHALWHRTLNAAGIETNPAHLSGSNVGVWTNVNTVDPKKAARSYSTSYYSSLAKHGNLHILTGASAKNVILSQDGADIVATGVRFDHKGKEYVASAKHEVILSGGSVQSPQLLELSGIGNPSILEAAGVPVVVNSPKVGENLQDHISKFPFLAGPGQRVTVFV